MGINGSLKVWSFVYNNMGDIMLDLRPEEVKKHRKRTKRGRKKKGA